MDPDTNTAVAEPSAQEAFDAKFDALDAVDAPAAETPTQETPTDDAPDEADKPEQASNPSDGKPTAPKPDARPDKPAAKPDAKPTVKADESDDALPAAGTPTQLRQFAQRQQQKAKKLATELEQLRSEVTKLKTQPADEKTVALEEMTKLQKRVEEQENLLRTVKYEQSTEYKEKYEKPYQTAYTRAIGELSELTVLVPNPDDPDNPTERPATRADFDEIYHAPLGKAARLANEKFGPAANIVLAHKQEIRRLGQAAMDAIEEHKGKGAEAEKTQAAQTQQQREAMKRMLSKAEEGFVAKNPQLYGERDDDPEGNELLSKGKAFANALYGDRSNLSPQQKVMYDARARMWVSAFPRLQRDLKAIQSQLAERDKVIAELRSSAPGKPAKLGGAAPKGKDDYVPAMEALDALPE
jgi:hypothetical protein